MDFKHHTDLVTDHPVDHPVDHLADRPFDHVAGHMADLPSGHLAGHATKHAAEHATDHARGFDDHGDLANHTDGGSDEWLAEFENDLLLPMAAHEFTSAPASKRSLRDRIADATSGKSTSDAGRVEVGEDLGVPHPKLRARIPAEPIALKMPITEFRETPTVRESLIECPKCHALNRVNDVECRKCGVVFERFREGDAETQAELLALAKNPVLIKQWDALLEDYNDLGAHHAFVADCERMGALAFASRKYSEILEVAPTEEFALAMQNQILGFAAIRTSVPLRSAPWIARVPMLNALVILLSAAAIMMGIYIPHMRSMAWLGAILLALSLALRFIALAR